MFRLAQSNFSLFLTLAFLISCQASLNITSEASVNNDLLKIVTWNVRGYPESIAEREKWFSDKLIGLDPNIICIQEIANQGRIDTFIREEVGFNKAAFTDVSADGQDNAIFMKEGVRFKDVGDPNGFKHLPQVAYVYYEGFDAVIITVHLTWGIGFGDPDRIQEWEILKNVVQKAMIIDPNVIVVGDFNTVEINVP